MNRRPFTSSNVKSIGYHDGVLEVEFGNGAVYRYHGVPKELHEEICAAPSCGKTLREKVMGKFPHRKKGEMNG